MLSPTMLSGDSRVRSANGMPSPRNENRNTSYHRRSGDVGSGALAANCAIIVALSARLRVFSLPVNTPVKGFPVSGNALRYSERSERM